MAPTETQYRTIIGQQEAQLFVFLRAFEALQEKIHFAKIKQHKQDLFDEVGDIFPPLNSALDDLTPPPSLEKFHQQWREVVAHLDDAYTSFLTGSESNFIVAYFQSRRAFSLGKYLLYSLRAQLPTLQKYSIPMLLLPSSGTRSGDHARKFWIRPTCWPGLWT